MYASFAQRANSFHGSEAKVVVETLDQRMLEVVRSLLEVHVRSFVLFVFLLG